MKKKVISIICIFICACVVIAFVKIKLSDNLKGAADKTSQNQTKNSLDKNASGKNSENSSSNNNASDGSNGSNGGSSNMIGSGESSEGDAEKKGSSVNFPYTIPNSKLVVTKYNSYDGAFIEDGSNKNVSKVAAVAIQNNSEKAVTYGSFKMKAGKKNLEFTFSTIPAGATVVVLEKNKKTYSKEDCRYVDSMAAYSDKLSLAKSEVSVKKGKKNGIIVKNLTDKKIPCVRVFYKYIMQKNVYVGGITYTAKIEDLGAGKSTTVYPKHFVKDGSEVMMVRTYNSKE